MRPANAGAPLLLVVGLVAGGGTSSLGAMPVATPPAVAGRPTERAREARASYASTASAINELRRLSGLTWDQLADLFGTSRRALHFWASGKPLNPANEERLHRTLGAIKRIDRGFAADNRSALLDGGETGELPLDMLKRGDFDGVVERLGTGPGRRTARSSPSRAERAKRAPPPPASLVDALHDPVHPNGGRRLSLDDLHAGRKG